MIDLLTDWYSWIRALHVISVISWMAGIFYLPRLFVYHTEQAMDVEGAQPIFDMMEEKLMRVIMRPAMMATWAFGLMLVLIPGIVDWSAVWPWLKGVSVIAMTWFHFWLEARRKGFVAGQNQLTGRQYRMMNEVPTLLMFVIVFSVVVKF